MSDEELKYDGFLSCGNKLIEERCKEIGKGVYKTPSYTTKASFQEALTSKNIDIGVSLDDDINACPKL